LKKAFRIFDDDDSGKISFENLKKVSDEIFAGNVTDAELRQMIKMADDNEDGEVDLNEFLKVMKKVKLI
jgi:centrin-1